MGSSLRSRKGILVEPQRDALIGPRKEGRTPMFGSAVIERRFDGNKSRQVLILATQTVEDPGADARAAEVEGARVHLENGAARGRRRRSPWNG